MKEQEEKSKVGCIAGGLQLFGLIGGIITIFSVINVAFDLKWGLRVYGARTELPTDWFTVIAIAIICAIAYGISALMTSAGVRNLFQKRPWLKWVTPIVIVLALSFGFYAVYYNIEYAGPLHYASRSNDIDAVKEELKNGVDEYDYHRSVYECIKLDHLEILALLLEQPNAKETINDDFISALEFGSMDVLIVFIEAGVGPKGESGDFLAQFLAVSQLPNDEKEIVGLKLLQAGADPNGVYTGGYYGTDLTAYEQAKELGLEKLVTAMETKE
ncbi:MAG: hypothetical protein H6600_04390 [Flavobacteriales bacterium]|nr:hypothetical protein [Flavobacteriales bacterium]